MLYPSMRRMSSDTVRTVSRVIDKVNASCGRSHGSQYCAVTARRETAVLLAPPPCHRVPRKNTHDPALITTGSRSAGSGSRSPHSWLPATMSVAPLSAVKSSIAQIVAAPNAFRGRGSG